MHKYSKFLIYVEWYGEQFPDAREEKDQLPSPAGVDYPCVCTFVVMYFFNCIKAYMFNLFILVIGHVQGVQMDLNFLFSMLVITYFFLAYLAVMVSFFIRIQFAVNPLWFAKTMTPFKIYKHSIMAFDDILPSIDKAQLQEHNLVESNCND